ncbi:CU044_2847 family protein [Actinoplanes sichuanensis]|uniref:CU044_2847 family protein n=1 Tax=Actinoplanes sichuanensis TaxID=512349 RepID=A0ABW4A4D7_9ACTN|nr:CU044_2847 family protein [Actinoplanes sichuanensis]
MELPVGDDDYVTVEVSGQGLVRAGAADVVERASERFDNALAQVTRMGQEAIRLAKKAPVPPEAVDVELGLKLTAKAGFVIAESSGAAHFKVVLRWTLAGKTVGDA